MEDQQIYRTNHTNNDYDTLYYQQQQPDVSRNLNHSYGTPSASSSQSSPVSPHFPQDSRDSSALSASSKSQGLGDSSTQTTWLQSGVGDVQMRNNLTDQSSQNMLWSSPGHSQSDGFHCSYPSQANEASSQKMSSGVLHKLDSFTQVFSTQNLRIQANSVSQGHHSQSSLLDIASDSALRQLLSQKPVTEQPSTHLNVQRYQQVPQHVHQSFANDQQNHLMGPQNQQQDLYYNYPQQLSQVQPQSTLQQGHHQVQHMQAQHMLPQQVQQPQYYFQPRPQGQQYHSLQEMQQQVLHQQQQRQCPVQISQYYQAQTVMQQIHQVVQLQQQQQQQHMHLQPSYHRDLNPNTAQETHQRLTSGSNDQVNPIQLIQLGTAPQYVYQNPLQQLKHYYQESSRQHQQPQQDVTEKKPHRHEAGSQLLMGPHTNLSTSDLTEQNMRQHCTNVVNQPPPSRPVTPILDSRGMQQQSPNTTWPQGQQPGSRLPTVSSGQSVQQKGKSEKCGVKSRLTCSICCKEFKSLPALNGHMRSHGGMRTSPIFKQDEGGKLKHEVKEVENFTPIIMPVSVPVIKLQSAEPSMPVSSILVEDKCASTVSDGEMPVLKRMTYSPLWCPNAPSPGSTAGAIRRNYQSGTATENSEENLKPQQEKKKYRHRPEPLFIPPPSPSLNMSTSGATLYQSQLRSPRILGDHLLVRTQELPPYTPPPMLSPVRQGSGLFSSVITAHGNAAYSQLPPTPLTPTPRLLLFRNSLDGGSIPVTPGPGEQTIDIEPRINIGPRFQAKIPELQSLSFLEMEEHKATLVWKPLTALESKACLQQVKDFLNMSCSSVLPGGGTNLEYAMHSLFEVNGDVMSALEMLLLKNKCRSIRHPLANYHYAGSDKWTPQEKKLFNKSLANNNKDFFHIQKMVNSKTLAQCVEYYYTWKKILRFGRKHRTRLADIAADCMTSPEENELEMDIDDEDELQEDIKSEQEEECELQNYPEPSVTVPLELPPFQILGLPSPSFICEMPNCGAIFSSRQALNGHARIHGGTNQVPKTSPVVPAVKHKAAQQSGYYSVKSSPAHSTTSGETDPTTIFPCKECCKVFFKIKSRNAHMKTHRQQEEQQRQKAQKAAVAAEMAATIARTAVPMGHGLIPFDHLMRHMEHGFDEHVAHDLGDVLDDPEVMAADFLLDDDGVGLLQEDTEL